jgi:hypothetical protein
MFSGITGVLDAFDDFVLWGLNDRVAFLTSNGIYDIGWRCTTLALSGLLRSNSTKDVECTLKETRCLGI